MIVLKLGGSILTKDIPNFFGDLKYYITQDEVILVHGGSYIVNDVAERMGVMPKFIVSPTGFRSRYTDEEMIEIYQMTVAGKVNKDLVAKLQSHGINALGLSGMDCALIKAKRKMRVKSVEEEDIRIVKNNYTGRIRRINPKVLRNLLSMGYIPVIAPIALGEEFEPLNIDGDRLAASVAGAVEADRLVIFTDVPGVLADNRLVRWIEEEKIDEAIRSVKAGMKRKLHGAKEALNLGVRKVIICSIFKQKPLTSALKHEDCTVISK
ncbi:MAG: [LysW]-aminoadipate kinase [Nitrososphaeria archaeon]|nr:[LysW]-aminoadipate kinase [Nitrososphaeria archaeon]NIQ32516.1 [LysW]-aminoadipate kinase [Nitrososphaeria archaeon]